MKIKINPKYAALTPQLSDGEYEQLKKSISLHGLHHPIVVNNKGQVLDGHHRLRICKELGIVPRTVVKGFPTPFEEEEFIIESNLLRRHLTPLQRASLGTVLEKIEEAKAKIRKKEGQIKGGKTAGKGRPKQIASTKHMVKAIDKKPIPQVDKIIAAKVGISHETYRKGKVVLKKAAKADREKVLKGKMTINAAYNKVKKKEREKHKPKTPKLPKDKYDVIYADPPWKYNFSPSESRSIESKYPTMTLEDICALAVPSAADSVLFLWATVPKLEEALKVINKWGFTYKTGMVWVKDKIGMGYYVRGKHELLLIATKGNPGVPSEKARPASVIIAPRTKHSEKPKNVYNIIEKMYPKAKYLEMFARTKRKGWAVWGNEL